MQASARLAQDYSFYLKAASQLVGMSFVPEEESNPVWPPLILETYTHPYSSIFVRTSLTQLKL